jgi:hypothetical protein
VPVFTLLWRIWLHSELPQYPARVPGRHRRFLASLTSWSSNAISAPVSATFGDASGFGPVEHGKPENAPAEDAKDR